jgi:hypothetical protein
MSLSKMPARLSQKSIMTPHPKHAGPATTPKARSLLDAGGFFRSLLERITIGLNRHAVQSNRVNLL